MSYDIGDVNGIVMEHSNGFKTSEAEQYSNTSISHRIREEGRVDENELPTDIFPLPYECNRARSLLCLKVLC